MRRAAVAHGLPTNLVTASRSVWRTVDRIWEAAGLGGAPGEGFSYYSRRATLAAVLVGTFLYWLEDQSESFADTWAFLDRRIEDVMRMGQARTWLEGLLGRRPKAAAT
jgi:ubiquinone biosynthesis protein COQ9